MTNRARQARAREIEAVDAAVILPTYNERETIPTVVGSLLDYQLIDEIVVVDDDSPDETWRVVRDRFPTERVTCIRRTNESGLSSAVLRGFDAADAPILACMDADGQHPPESLGPLVIEVRDGADLAVGSRHTETGRVADEWPAHRQIISWGASAMAWAAVPPARELTDPMSGFFAVRADVVEAVRDQLRPRGYKILLELLARCPVEDIREHGYTFRKRQGGGSNLGFAEYAKYAEHLARLSVPARQQVAGVAPEVAAEEVGD